MFLILVSTVFSLDVILLEPSNNAVFNTTNEINFICNVSNDSYIKNISLYTNISGSFKQEKVKRYGEIDADNYTVLLMHFNNDSSVGENDSFVYDWSGNKNHGTVYEIDFNSSGGKFFGSFEFNGSGYMEINHNDILNLQTFTIEFWIKSNDISNPQAILAKASETSYSPYSFVLDYGGFITICVADFYEAMVCCSSQTHLEPYNYYHVVGMWKWPNLTLYINGSLECFEENEIYPYIFQSIEPLYIGKELEYGTYDFFNGSIDELVIYNRLLSEEEIREHYENGVLLKNITQEWTINNIQDGTYIWNCLAYNYNSESARSSSNNTIFIDLYTPPTIEDIKISPSSDDDIDPDVLINVTAKIIDPSGVDTAIFQYKREGTITWNNITMNYLQDNLWNVSFIPTSPPGKWNYRIWVNDSTGNSRITNQYNLSVDYDYSWTMTPESFGEVRIPVGENGTLGILIINNTGDYPLNFRLSSNWENIFYNITNYDDFDVDAKTIKAIEINATAPITPYEYSIQITTYATIPQSNPNNLTTDVKLVAYVSGPYFILNIDSPASVLQSQTFNLTAIVRNIGNDTATNVWLDWLLPKGWINISGSLLQFLEDVSSSEKKNFTITIFLDPNKASAGISTIYLSVNCSENINKTSYAYVNVNCNSTDKICGVGCTYSSDQDCPVPKPEKVLEITTPPIIPEYQLLLNSPKKLNVYRNESGSFFVEITNPKEKTIIKNITLSISGYPIIHTKIYPEFLDELLFNQTKNFTVEIFAPTYMSYGEYKIEILVIGYGTSNFTSSKKTVTASGKIIIAIHSISENETIESFKKALEAIEELEKNNLPVEKIKKILDDAKKALDEWDFDKAKELSDQIISIKEKALSVYYLLQKVDKFMEESTFYKVSTPETKKMYSLALSALYREDYSRAEERAKNAILMYSIEGRYLETIKFIHNYWLAIIFSTIIIIGAGIFIHKRFILSSIVRKIKLLDIEEKTVESMIKKAQVDHFIKKTLSKTDYEKIMEEYDKRLNEIKMKKISLFSKKLGLVKVRKKESLLKEKEHLENLMKELQEKYFKKGTIGKKEYEKAMKEFELKLLEINKRIELIG